MASNGSFYNFNGDLTPYNSTLYHRPYLCTTQTCPLDWATIRYVPSLGGNVFYAVLFSACLSAQVILGIIYRTWPFLIAWIFGLALEVVGYIARVMMHNNIFEPNPFLIYLICLTIAPAFLSGGIYLCLSRIIVVYGEHLARFKPRTYTVIFVCSDIFALVLQALGGAIADTTTSGSPSQRTGVNIMIAGLAFQVISLTIFIILCLDFAWRIRTRGVSSRPTIRLFGCGPARFHIFMLALATATLTIYIRSCFRVAELKSGFNGKLANQQVTFMILEGAMVSLAALSLTIMHPGPVLKDFYNINVARKRINEVSTLDDGDSGTIELFR